MEESENKNSTSSVFHFSDIERNPGREEDIDTWQIIEQPKFEADELDEFTSRFSENRFPSTSLRHTTRVGTSVFPSRECDTPESRSHALPPPPPCRRVRGLSRRVAVASKLLGAARGSAELF